MVTAAFRYFALVFLVGFLLGTLRVLFIMPALGERNALLLELPLMLVASFAAARHVLRRSGIARQTDALVVGLLAFAMLIGAEIVLALSLSGQTLGGWTAHQFSMPGAIGFAAQLVFALIPWLLCLGRRHT